MLVLVLLVGGECVGVKDGRSRRCTESVVASCVSVADQNIGINKPKPSDNSRQDRARQAPRFIEHLTSSESTICYFNFNTSYMLLHHHVSIVDSLLLQSSVLPTGMASLVDSGKACHADHGSTVSTGQRTTSNDTRRHSAAIHELLDQYLEVRDDIPLHQ